MAWHIWRVSNDKRTAEYLIAAECAIDAIRSISARAAGREIVGDNDARGGIIAEKVLSLETVSTVEGYELRMIPLVRQARESD